MVGLVNGNWKQKKNGKPVSHFQLTVSLSDWLTDRVTEWHKITTPNNNHSIRTTDLLPLFFYYYYWYYHRRSRVWNIRPFTTSYNYNKNNKRRKQKQNGAALKQLPINVRTVKDFVLPPNNKNLAKKKHKNCYTADKQNALFSAFAVAKVRGYAESNHDQIKMVQNSIDRKPQKKGVAAF